MGVKIYWKSQKDWEKRFLWNKHQTFTTLPQMHQFTKKRFHAVFRICEILKRIRILGSVALTNGYGCGCISIPTSSVNFRMLDDLNWIFSKKISELKFYFATIILVCSIPLWEKARGPYLWLTNAGGESGTLISCTLKIENSIV